MNFLPDFFPQTPQLHLAPQTFQLLNLLMSGCLLLLFLFQLYTVMHCMARPVSQFPTPSDRVVWSLLSILIPLGLGAWLYHGVTRGRWFHPYFVIPFLGYGGIQVYLIAQVGLFNFR